MLNNIFCFKKQFRLPNLGISKNLFFFWMESIIGALLLKFLTSKIWKQQINLICFHNNKEIRGKQQRQKKTLIQQIHEQPKFF